jgi:hypothetical protein
MEGSPIHGRRLEILVNLRTTFVYNIYHDDPGRCLREDIVLGALEMYRHKMSSFDGSGRRFVS